MTDRNHSIRHETSALALRILNYVTRHPNATDTIEGISRFWLEGDFATAEVEETVLGLVDGNLLKHTLKPDGEWLYSRGQERRPAAGEAS